MNTPMNTSPFTLLHAKVEMITPQRAASLLASYAPDPRRPLSQHRTSRLARQIESGRLGLGRVALGRWRGQLRLVDGRHTLCAVIQTGIAIEARVERYQVAGPDGFALLAERLRPSDRRQPDIHRAAALGAIWPPRTLKLVLGALVLGSGISRGRAGENIAVLLVGNIEAGDFVARLLSGRSRHLRRRAIVAAMLRTWQVAPEEAEDFWLAVRDGENMRATMPQYHLRDFLLDCYRRQGLGLHRSSDHELLCRCIAAWNACRDGKNWSQLHGRIGRQVPRTR